MPGVTQKQMLGQTSSKKGSYAYSYGLDDRYGNPQVEKVSHGGKDAYVKHDPVTGDPLFLRDTDKTSVHMYIADPINAQIRIVKDNGSSSDVKSFDPFGARDEKVTTNDRDAFDPYRYRFGLVDHGGTGRYLFGVRHYDPGHGVWVEQDSLDSPVDPVNANRYAYVGADPINNIDPAGRNAHKVNLQACFGLCGDLGVTFSNEGKANLELGAEVGPKASAGLTLGETTNSTGSGDFSVGGGCTGGIGVGGGFNTGYNILSNTGYADAGFGGVEGLGCSGGIFGSIPLN